ncbi:MAG TPA: alpha/beta hydrolase [Thermodesulfobacteriota bacterium]|nr:alpha/beta hydrolase [Thermodesulfobacteriota bacterium]
MIDLRWMVHLLLMPFRWERRIPLVRPHRINWNPSLPPLTVQVNGRSIFYTVKGEGEPVLLIHGYGAGMWVWEKQIDYLSQSYRVYTLDLLGHGFSDRPKIPYTPETYFNSLKAFMEGVGIKKATLIGNSMGGGIAWGMAILFPERVHRLVLINSAPPDVLKQVKNDSFRTLVTIQPIPLLPRLLIASRDQKSIRLVFEECVFDTGKITPQVLHRQYQLLRIKGTTWVLSSTLRNAGEALKFKSQLSKISAPTLVIWGEKDLIFPLSVGESLHQDIPISTFKVIEKSGHIPMWETPDEVNGAILSFLKN